MRDLTPVKHLSRLHELRLPDGERLGDFENTPENRRAVQDFLATL